MKHRTPEEVVVDQMREQAPDEFAQMQDLVRRLPEREQKRLAALPPSKFRREAVRLIRKWESIRAHDERRPPNPNTDRHRRKTADELAPSIEQFIRRVEEHTHTPEPEIVSLAEYERRKKQSDV
jgi:hypothetical protein